MVGWGCQWLRGRGGGPWSEAKKALSNRVMVMFTILKVVIVSFVYIFQNNYPLKYGQLFILIIPQ